MYRREGRRRRKRRRGRGGGRRYRKRISFNDCERYTEDPSHNMFDEITDFDINFMSIFNSIPQLYNKIDFEAELKDYGITDPYGSNLIVSRFDYDSSIEGYSNDSNDMMDIDRENTNDYDCKQNGFFNYYEIRKFLNSHGFHKEIDRRNIEEILIDKTLQILKGKLGCALRKMKKTSKILTLDEYLRYNLKT